jgi:hypothetical protein
MFEQLEQTKQQLRQAQTQLMEQKRRDSSPISNMPGAIPKQSLYMRYDDQQLSAAQSTQKPPVIER